LPLPNHIRAVEKRKLEILDSIQTKIDEEEIEESEIPFNDLPLEKQTEIQRSVREIIEREKKAINEQLKDAQTQMLEDLKKQEIEAQAKINERLRTALLFIDQHLINAEDADIVKQFADILGLMKSDSEHNL
jgi:vacuolar-type H+-ATPase subunit I/STV1